LWLVRDTRYYCIGFVIVRELRKLLLLLFVFTCILWYPTGVASDPIGTRDSLVSRNPFGILKDRSKHPTKEIELLYKLPQKKYSYKQPISERPPTYDAPVFDPSQLQSLIERPRIKPLFSRKR
jgi:hypothetical protein